MNKLVKRTLAFLLVVCTLFSTMVMPTFATNDGTGETTTTPEAVTYTYDFTAMSQTKTVEEGAEPMWKLSTATTPKYGFGNYRIDKTGAAVDWMKDFYSVGYRNGNTTADPIYYYKDLNWKVVAVADNSTQDVHNSSDGSATTSDMDRVHIGGYYHNTEASKHPFSGIRYQGYTVVIGEFEDGSERRTAKESQGGWIAFNIKAPDVGTYTVSLDHLQTKYGATQGSVYIVPGAVSDVATIEGYIANGTGKLDNTVDYFEEYKTINTSTAANKVTGLPVTNDEMGFAVTTELGTVTLDEVNDEYTVIFTSDKNRAGTTSADCARVYLEALTFTQQDEAETFIGNDRNYSFQLNAYIGNTEDKLFTNASDIASTGYAEKLDNLYGTLGWDYLGSDFHGNKQIRNGYLYFLNAGSNSAPKHIGLKLKSPGEGKYRLDLTGYVMTKTGDTVYFDADNDKTTSAEGKTDGKEYSYVVEGAGHLWLDVKILKLNKAEGITEETYDQHIDKAVTVGTYDPAMGTYYTADQWLENEVGVFTFEKDAEYIVYLVRANQTIDSTHSTTDNNYVQNNVYIASMKATALPVDVASVGVDFTPPKGDEFSIVRTDAMKSTLQGFTTTGAKNAETGVIDYTAGYAITKAGVKNLTAYFGEATSNASSQIIANYNFLRMNNSSVKSTAASKVYYYTEHDANNSTVTIDTASPVTNYNAKKMLDDMYAAGTLNWKLLGSSVTTNVYAFDSDKMYIYNISGNDYAAFKIKASETGNFEVDLTVKHAADTSTNELRHMGLKVYIFKDDGSFTGNDDYKLSGTLPAAPNAQYLPAYNQSEQGDSICAAPLIVYDDENKTAFTYDFVKDQEYIVVLQRDAGTTVTGAANATAGDDPDDGFLYRSTDNIWLNNIVLTPTETEATEAVEYTTLTAALEAAKNATSAADKIVKLQENLVVSNVVVPAGVTLDLNGYTLTAGKLQVLPTGKLVGDSVKILANGLTFTDLTAFDGKLPVYDADNTCYKFFAFTNDGSVAKANADGDQVKFWYTFRFEDDAAYDLLATENSGVTFGVDVTYTGATEPTSYYFANSSVEGYEADNVNAWAAAYAKFAKDATSPWLWVNVRSVDLLDAGTVLSVTPFVSAGGQYINLAEISYEVPGEAVEEVPEETTAAAE